ncbi:hypothetical protein LCGC14_2441070 [marine sediment metagenome]|uniref:Core-binding (CB) domain-containing protein n=1 Tax=marine sediment metagenome TaxID=412755 RepID=A0A0F9BJ38_9ZZZZ
MSQRKRKASAMNAVNMTVFLPKRRPAYVAKWTDPVTGKRPQRTLGTKVKREAFVLAAELADKVVAGVAIDDLDWGAFCAKYEREKLRKRSHSTQEGWGTTKRHIRDFGEPATLQDVTAGWVSAWQAHLEDTGMAVNSVAVYSRYLRAAVNWAARYDLIARAPFIAVEIEAVPRSDGVQPVDFKRLLAAVPTVRPKDAARWDRLLRGLSGCNLRISELRRLSWDPGAEIRIDMGDVYPLIRFRPKSHKTRKRRIQVILPQFWDVCTETAMDDRQGFVFPVPNGRGGQISLSPPGSHSQLRRKPRGRLTPKGAAGVPAGPGRLLRARLRGQGGPGPRGARPVRLLRQDRLA